MSDQVVSFIEYPIWELRRWQERIRKRVPESDRLRTLLFEDIERFVRWIDSIPKLDEYAEWCVQINNRFMYLVERAIELETKHMTDEEIESEDLGLYLDLGDEEGGDGAA
jgi:hypothetical protein